MYDWLMHMHHDVLVVATKCDKISKGQWQKHVEQVREGLKTDKSPADFGIFCRNRTRPGRIAFSGWKPISPEKLLNKRKMKNEIRAVCGVKGIADCSFIWESLLA